MFNIASFYSHVHGLNFRPGFTAPGGKNHDNENGVVWLACWWALVELLPEKERDFGIASSLVADLIGKNLCQITYKKYNEVHYSRYHVRIDPPSVHKNDMSLDNLIAIAFFNKSAAKDIAKILNGYLLIYDDIYPSKPRLSRFQGLRPDFLYFIYFQADQKIKAFFLYPLWLGFRLLSTLRTRVVRPTIYQYISAHWKWYFLKSKDKKEEDKTPGEKEIERQLKLDKIWRRNPNILDVSGKILTLIMLQAMGGNRIFRKFFFWRIRKQFGSFTEIIKYNFTVKGAYIDKNGKSFGGLPPMVRLAEMLEYRNLFK